MAETDDIAPKEESPAAEAIVNDRFAVDLSMPLAQFNTAGASAFAARDIVDARRKVYAVVQRLGVPRRDNVVTKLMGRTLTGLSSPRGEGIVTVTDRDGQGQRLVTILDAPQGGRVVDNSGSFAPISERVIKEVIAPQFASMASHLESLAITHRSLSINNLYYRDRNRTEILFGECFSAPPAYHQSPAYEPIERAFADPAGRGAGDLNCDMYALGVTLMSLFLGRDVGAESAAGFTQLEARIRSGSYWALGGTNELAGAMGDLLRGLMEDNPSKRWGPEDFKRWVDGLVGRKTVSDPGWILARQTMFRDKPYKDRRHLAIALLEAPREAITFARSDRFRHWIDGALAEGPTPDWLDRALDERTFGNDQDLNLLDEHMAVARLMAIFFPEGPICFGPLRVCGDGLAGALAMAQANGDSERADLIRELFQKSRMTMLLDLLGGRSPALRTSMAKLSGAIPWATSTILGHGMERCLYELNKNLPCLSPKIRGSYVNSPRKLAIALEAAAGRGEVGAGVIDNHLAAFMIAHSPALEGPIARLANVSLKPEAHLTETLRVLGTLQEKFYSQPLRNLAQAMMPVLKKQVEGLKSATRKRQVGAALKALLEEGNLMRLARDLNMGAVRQRDEREFGAARQQYLAVVREQKRLEIPIGASDTRIQAEGHRFMAYVSFAAVLVVAVVSFFQTLS